MGMFSHEPECTADVGVMGHLGCTTPGCSCHEHTEIDYRVTEARYSRNQSQVAVFSASYGSSEVEPDIKLKYEFIVHQTDKAILFAFKGEHGIYQQWIPRSVITAQTDKKVSVKSWFARRFV